MTYPTTQNGFTKSYNVHIVMKFNLNIPCQTNEIYPVASLVKIPAWLVSSHCPRVGHRVLFPSERSVLSRFFKEHSVLSRSFLEVLVTYESQKNGMCFPVLFKRTGKNVKNVSFFCKERERTQRMFRSFIKNRKERKKRSVLL